MIVIRNYHCQGCKRRQFAQLDDDGIEVCMNCGHEGPSRPSLRPLAWLVFSLAVMIVLYKWGT